MIAKIQALNPAGWGPFSPVNIPGAKVANVRPLPAEPMVEQSTTDSSAVISWGKQLEEPIDSSLSWYELWTNSGPQGEF